MEIEKEKIISQDLDLDLNYKLSALINVDSFFYALLDEERSFHSLNQIPISHSSMSYISSGHSLKISKTCLGILTNQFTLIPSSEYIKQEETLILEEAVQPNANFRLIVNSDYLAQVDAYLTYGIPQYIYEHCTSHFEDCNFCHVVASIINAITTNNPKTIIHISKIGDEIIFICFKNGILKLANIFRNAQPLTILYYVKLMDDTYDLIHDHLSIEFSGAFTSQDSTIELLKKYYKRIESYKIEMSLKTNNTDLDSILFPLHSIAQCA